MSKNNLVVDRENKTTSMSRVFNASRELVWKAHIDPTLIPQWWGLRNLSTRVDKMDVKVGGVWRFIHTDDKDQEYAFNGVYKEITEPESLTLTFNFEPIGDGHEITETMTFEDLGVGKTKVTSTSRYNSIEDLDGMMSTGMEKGAEETWDRLTELVEKD